MFQRPPLGLQTLRRREVLCPRLPDNPATDAVPVLREPVQLQPDRQSLGGKG